MATVLPKETFWSDVGEQFGSGLGQGYTSRADEKALQKSIAGLSPNATPREIIDAITQTRTYSPEAKQKVLENRLGVAEMEELKRDRDRAHAINEEKNKINANKALVKATALENKQAKDREVSNEIVDQLNLPEEVKAPFRNLPATQSAALLTEQIKEANKGKQLTPGEKELSKHYAQEFIDLSKEVPILKDNNKTFDEIEKLSDKIGLLGRLNPISSKMTELNALSFPLMQPIIKIFNPTGAIAVSKIELIKSKYNINPTDTPNQAKAKIKALRYFNNLALARSAERLNLLKEHNLNPPITVLEHFDKVSETMSDAMMDYELTGEEAPPDITLSLPDPTTKQGKTISSPTGEKFYSDGVRWVRK